MSSSEAAWHEELSSAFLQARDLTPDARVAFLRKLSATDAEMADWVERMLAAEGKSSPILGGSSRGPFLKFAAPDIGGSRIGRYTIQRRIGTGGMGAVYEAEQDQPRRTVAVKVLPSGLGSQTAARRFEYESSVLARLRHPGIAQVYEAGLHREDGLSLPYFAMEFVPQAQSITDYAKATQLTPRDIVQLLIRVCEAVQHGHQRGVIHRDLKPDNILVDANGEPKVIDFGVARAIDRDVQALTLQTEAGQLVGTIPYMSPEQLGGSDADLDIRTDVYALGVVLFEMLTGRLPYDFENKSVVESIDLIRNTAPAPARTINSNIPVDLDTIVTKALMRDCNHRYQSVAEFSTDLQRFLDNEPIAARAPSVGYQMRKFAARHRGVVMAAVLLLLTLLAGVVAERYRANQALAARNDAIVARDVADEAKRRAQQEAKRANRVVAFLDNMLSKVTPDEARGKDVTVQEVLDAVAKEFDDEFDDAPQVEATIRYIVGNTYLAQGLYPRAQKILQQAAELHEAHGWETVDTVLILRALAQSCVRQRELDLALSAITKAQKIFDRSDSTNWELRLQIMNTKSEALYLMGRSEEAVTIVETALAEYESGQEGDTEDLHTLRGNLATLYERVGRLDEAVGILKAEIEWYRANPEAARSKLHNLQRTLAGTEFGRGHYDRAIAIFKELESDVREHSGPDHPDLAEVLMDLGTMLQRINQGGSALVYLREAVAINNRIFGDNHRKSADALNALAGALSAQGRFDEALPLQERAIEGTEAAGETDTLFYGQALHQYANMLRMTNQCEKALAIERRALEIAQRHAGPDHPSTLNVESLLALIEVTCGDAERGVALLEQGHKRVERTYPAGHPAITMGFLNMGSSCIVAGQIDKAIAYHHSALEGLASMGASGMEIMRQALGQLAILLQVVDRPADAQQRVEEALNIDFDKNNPGHSYLFVKTAEASLKLTQGETTDAVAIMDDVWPRIDPDRMQNDLFAVIATITQARCLLARDETDEANALFEKANARLIDRFGSNNPVTVWAKSFAD